MFAFVLFVYNREDNCPSLHKLIPDGTSESSGPQPNILPSNGVVEVSFMVA